MDGSWKDQIIESQLLAAAQTLKVRMFDNREEVRDIDRRRCGDADGLAWNHAGALLGENEFDVVGGKIVKGSWRAIDDFVEEVAF